MAFDRIHRPVYYTASRSEVIRTNNRPSDDFLGEARSNFSTSLHSITFNNLRDDVESVKSIQRGTRKYDLSFIIEISCTDEVYTLGPSSYGYNNVSRIERCWLVLGIL